MHPIIHDILNSARIGEFHRRAERDRLARAVIQARRARRGPGTGPAGGRAAGAPRRQLTIWGDRGVWPERALAWARSRW